MKANLICYNTLIGENLRHIRLLCANWIWISAARTILIFSLLPPLWILLVTFSWRLQILICLLGWKLTQFSTIFYSRNFEIKSFTKWNQSLEFAKITSTMIFDYEWLIFDLSLFVIGPYALWFVYYKLNYKVSFSTSTSHKNLWKCLLYIVVAITCRWRKWLICGISKI